VALADSVEEVDKHSLRPDAKTAIVLVLALYGLASWAVLVLSVPPWARRITQPIGYEEWLGSVLAIPAVRVVVMIGVVVGFVVFYVEALSLMRDRSDKSKKKARKREYRCPTCGHTWDQGEL
jgi:hypothetical protein